MFSWSSLVQKEILKQSQMSEQNLKKLWCERRSVLLCFLTKSGLRFWRISSCSDVCQAGFGFLLRWNSSKRGRQALDLAAHPAARYAAETQIGFTLSFSLLSQKRCVASSQLKHCFSFPAKLGYRRAVLPNKVRSIFSAQPWKNKTLLLESYKHSVADAELIFC